MVYRVFVEKKRELANEAAALREDCVSLLGIKGLKDVRILNRYDVENITEELFERAVQNVFSEPQIDLVSFDPDLDGDCVFAVEYLPGQFDQRADSAAQCIQLIAQIEKPPVRSAKVYVLYGQLTDDQISEIKNYVVNPVEARIASLEKPETLAEQYEMPDHVVVLDGFNELSRAELEAFIGDCGLAMDLNDILFCQEYFRSEGRDPSITEIRVIDTYWSDHCRHTTFLTTIDSVSFEDPEIEKIYQDYLDVRKELGRTKPVCLMDVATVAVKYLKAKGMMPHLDESEEINACTVKINVNVDGEEEPWLLLFKNETHNHPTEIEPFGGAATCIGGAIRDPLSGRSYVYGAMRITGAADPLKDVRETLPGKLPQRKIVVTAAEGYSSYGNQIGLATGIVDEIYHPGYEAKRMEIGAVIAAAPACNVKRERPEEGDIVILLGGSTGRDGIGGATGSSKAHDSKSVETCGAEVQKGNAPEERKLQRLFRNPKASCMIKRCNDFGAGGVSVAIGELADGLVIDLNAVPKKYEGLDGTELAISESQERMAVVVEKQDVDEFLALADSENLQACPVAVVSKEPRLVMHWNGQTIVDISRDFMNSNGAEKHIDICVGKDGQDSGQSGSDEPANTDSGTRFGKTFDEALTNLAGDLNICSKRGLSERFDSTIGAGAVMMPFGGKYQLTPVQAMATKIAVEHGHTDDCSLMSWGYNPYLTEQSPYRGAYLAVIESVCKLIASGAEFKDVYLTFQEYFEKLGTDSRKWGKPLAALLGAFKAQKELGIGAIGGKDSMSGSFEEIHVPPTLVSFAVTTAKTGDVVSPEFKEAGHNVWLLSPDADENGLPKAESLKNLFTVVRDLTSSGKALAVYTPGFGGIAEAVIKMSLGNGFGFEFSDEFTLDELFGYCYGSFVIETEEDPSAVSGANARLIGQTSAEPVYIYGGQTVSAETVTGAYENKLEPVFSCNIDQGQAETETITYTGKPAVELPAFAVRSAKPQFLIPAFPGTNCEVDTARAIEDAGGLAKIVVINNLSPEGIRRSIGTFAKEARKSQVIFIPGGFSGGDEPDGSGKFITAFFRNAEISAEIQKLLDERGGLMAGICNGFQALIKLGLVPYGKIVEPTADSPTLTYNTIARHQSKIVRTRIASVVSPWLSYMNVGDIVNVPISHGEGRFMASDAQIESLVANGQIATQYVDLNGEASMDIRYNPNGSSLSIEGITSPDGRVFGKMGHSERIGTGLYKNVPGNYDNRMFEAAVRYFKE